jgi:carboxyl-terminal processing protease
VKGYEVHSESANHSAAQKPRMNRNIKTVGLVVFVGIVFMLGIFIGNGAIKLNTVSNSTNQSLPEDLDYSSVEELYDALKANYDGKLSEQELIDGLKSGLAEATGDPYTEYFNPKDAKAFNEQLSGSFTGIGAQLGKDDQDNLIIVSPIEGFPADKAGLRPKDVIATIDKKPTTDMSIDEAVSHIRGEKDTKVTLGIIRDKKQELSFTITRADIKVPSVNTKMLEGNIGYLQITQFSSDTTQLATKAAQEFADKKVKGIVLDLRSDPGGLLDAAVEVSSLWLPAGQTILTEKQGGVVRQTYTADGSDLLKGVPTAVLINSGSASAAEIVAGALRDNNAAKLFGEKSYGKGSVQKILDLPNGAEAKITVARWYRPNGQNIDKKGINPDKVVTMSDEDYDQNRDPQQDAALDFLRSQ